MILFDSMHTRQYHISADYLMTNIYILPHVKSVNFFLYSAHALYNFCYKKNRVSPPPPPFYKRKKLNTYLPKDILNMPYISIQNIINQCIEKAYSTPRGSQAVPHLSTNRALRCLTAEFGRDPVCSTRYGRKQKLYLIPHLVESICQ